MLIPIFTSAGITEFSPIVTKPKEYTLGFSLFGTSSPTPITTLFPTVTFSAMIALSIVTFSPIKDCFIMIELRTTLPFLITTPGPITEL